MENLEIVCLYKHNIKYRNMKKIRLIELIACVSIFTVLFGTSLVISFFNSDYAKTVVQTFYFVNNPIDPLYNDLNHIIFTGVTQKKLFSEERDFDTISMDEVDKITVKIKEEVRKFILKGRELDKTIVMVTNEVGLGLVPSYRLGRIFRDIAGFVNQYIGSLSDEIYLVCCGQPLKIK